MLKRAACTLVLASPLIGLVANCGAGNENCPAITGQYVPDYAPLAGTCGPISDALPVTFDGGRKGVKTTTMRTLDANVSTEVVLKGCTVRMTQTVQDKTGALMSQIDAEKLAIEDATRLSGQVTMVRFDAMGQVACSGTYDAKFNRKEDTVGGAAMH